MIWILDPRFVAFLAVFAVLIITPGPDTALTVRNALASGWRGASFTTLGVAVGTLWWVSAAVLGVATLLEKSVTLYDVLRLAGAAYLCYLGLRSLIATLRRDRPTANLSAGPQSGISDGLAFKQGLTSNLLNPKTGPFFLSVLPQFVRPGDSPIRLLLMVMAYELMLLAWLNLYGLVVSRARRNPVVTRIRAALQTLTGFVLIALGVRLALERRLI